jgi:hypothetical protein
MDDEIIVEGTPEEELPIEVEVEPEATSDRPAFDEAAIRKQEEEDAQDIEKFPRPIKKRFETLTYHVRERERQLEEERKNSQALFDYANGAKNVIEQLSREKEELQKSLQREALAAREAQIHSVQREFAAARESADVEKEVEANRKLAEITQQRSQIAQFQPQAAFQPPPPPQRQQTEPQIPQETVEWVQKNPWFLEDRNMQGYAVAYSANLVAQGVAEGSQTYYNRIDAEMRKRFPESFDTSAMSDIAKPQQSARQVSRPPVATAPRTSSATNGTRKIVLTANEAATARKLGVPLEEYAKHAKRG